MTIQAAAMGSNLARIEGAAKVTGTAPYAYEHVLGDPVHVYPLLASIAHGRVRSMDTARATALDGVVTVLTAENAVRLEDTGNDELQVLQTDSVAFRGQFIGAILAETPEIARHAASLVHVDYDKQTSDTELSADRPDLYIPDQVNPAYAAESNEGDIAAALEASTTVVDATYSTPSLHNTPIEPHTTVAIWDDDGEPRLTMYDSTQGAHTVRRTLAPLLGIRREHLRVVAPHVGGGFGSKGMPHAHNVLAVLAARALPGRPVKLALTRQQTFPLTGHRTPTIQHIRLGATADGHMTAIEHDAVEHTSTVKEFAEQTAVGTRMMYAAANRRTAHRLAALDVPVPSWMRAPGECPGIHALEVVVDELAVTCGLDPIELRIRNDPEVDPETRKPWSARNLVSCLRTGAERFGWERRPKAPGTRRDGDMLVGYGVASSTYPRYGMPGSVASIEYRASGQDHDRYVVRIGATDIGTGTWTALTQIAADALGCGVDSVELRIGDTELPTASVAGGSSGITSWGSTIVTAARAFRDEHGLSPQPGAHASGEMPDNPDLDRFAVHSFGAHFVEVHVDVNTGEIRVPRMLGVFSVGRVINPRTARSQFIGGMTMGLSMALHEHGTMDHRTGHVVNHDLAEYHIATCADVRDLDAIWLDEVDPHANPMGAKGIGEIGIVGSPAAVVNAVYNATGIRVRDLPITPDKVMSERPR